MTRLTADHISYIIQDISYRGIILDGVQEEIIDHLCASVEAEMDRGTRFIDAYKLVLKRFGNDEGLQQTQKEIIESENQQLKNMLQNYFTSAWRSLRKQGFYSAINIFGLSVGVAACLIITLFIRDELTYDQWNPNADRIHRLNSEIQFNGNRIIMTYQSPPTASTLQQDYPEIESTVRFRSMGSYLVRAEKAIDNIKEKNVIWTDSTFFKLFPVTVLEGNPVTALREPASIAISKKMADKYFPGISALGQSMILDNNYHGKVTAVYADLPAASHFHFDILVAMVGEWPIAREAQGTSYLSNNFTTYLLLKKNADPRLLESKIPEFLEKHLGPDLANAFGGDFSMKKFLASGNKYNITMIPLKDIHLHSDLKGDFEPNGSLTYVYLFAAIALLILAIACINFMNLSTARSAGRAKEVGVRKVMGSLRIHLIRQFLTESALISLFAFVVAMVLVWIALPVFNDLAQKQIRIPFGDGQFYVVMLGCCLAIGIVAGLYPSFFLSAFKPVNVLKAQGTAGPSGGFVRSSLVVFQFVISIFLIVGAITIHRQLEFIQTTKLGFEKDQVIIVHDAYALRPNKVNAFRDAVVRNSSIESGTISGHLPVENQDSYRNNSTFWKEGVQPTDDNLISCEVWGVDNEYIPTFKMTMKQGRNFSSQFPSDSSAVILNAVAVRRFGLGDDPIGKKVATFRDVRPPDPSKLDYFTVIGVVNDFNYSSMKEGITPLGLFLRVSDGNVSFRFKPGNTGEVIATIEKAWKSLAPGQPLQYSFLDEDFSNMYKSEARLGTIFMLFASLAIVIACLGLFALTAFTAEQRTKEIGIRKVLGATVNSVLLLLSKDFSKLILIAFVISAPVAWYAVNWWLKSYTFKTEIGPGVYLLAGSLALVIALVTISYHAFKAAAANPIKALRSE